MILRNYSKVPLVMMASALANPWHCAVVTREVVETGNSGKLGRTGTEFEITEQAGTCCFVGLRFDLRKFVTSNPLHHQYSVS